MEVPKHFASTIVEDRNFHECVSAHFDKYAGSSLFNLFMKSSSKKGNVDKHSISMAVGCMLLDFEMKAVELPLNTLRA